LKKNILYIFIGNDLLNHASGVRKKVISKIENLNTADSVCQGISFSNEISEPINLENCFTIIPFQKKQRRFFNSTYQNRLVYKSLNLFLDEQIHKYTHIIFRYPLASYSLFKLVKKHQNKIVFEHNTKEIEELELQSENFRNSLLFSIKPGYFIYLLERGYFQTRQEKYYAKKIFQYAHSGIAVTNEIANYEMGRCNSYQVSVITNGIETEVCQLRNLHPFNGNELNMFMLLGAGSAWHGIDRIINSLENYKGDKKITLDFIGNLSEFDLKLISKSRIKNQIRIINSVNEIDMNNLLNKYHIGLGSLSIYKIGLEEATPLKTREYMARGFPIVIGYTDTDMMNHSEFQMYCYQVPNNNSVISMDSLFHFVESVYLDIQHPEKIRMLAFKYMDTKVKMNALLNLLN
jgi:hypothetical protein